MSAGQACHNCRRQRLKCDRSIPKCLKCTQRDQDCLGYGRLFRWAQGIASRGKMAGKTFETIKDKPAHDSPTPQSLTSTRSSRPHSSEDNVLPLCGSLTDPLIQDINHLSRKYLSYFASRVCKELVLYDTPKHNPFRELIPMTHRHPILLHVIIANSALHMSNASQKILVLDPTAFPAHGQKAALSPENSTSLAPQLSGTYRDALAAKQRALCLLQSALQGFNSVDIDVTLAVVLLFIEFELIDSGRDNWKHHLGGARTIIDRLCGPNISTQAVLSPLRSCLISNCLVFDILGSTLASSMGLVPSDTISTGALSLLLDEEGNHCSSFPVSLLQLIRVGAQLSQYEGPPVFTYSGVNSKEKQALQLLESAESFDPLVWATNIQARSPAIDVEHRTRVASAHCAAVRIYLSRVLFLLTPAAKPSRDLEDLVADVITQLSYIRPSDVLFTATTWPAFIAGAETNDPAKQAWVTRRLQELWEVEPWGLMRGALEVLERMWAGRTSCEVVWEDTSLPEQTRGGKWILELKAMGVDWLIV